jgi:hypothetical protein
MRILLDENLPRKLIRHLSGHEPLPNVAGQAAHFPVTPCELSRLRGGRYAWERLPASLLRCDFRCDFLASGENSA